MSSIDEFVSFVRNKKNITQNVNGNLGFTKDFENPQSH